MATTRITDTVVPEVFFPYMIKRTKERGAIFQSGILRSDANLSSFLTGGGRTANVPFWRDLADDGSFVGSDDPAELIVHGKISALKDVAARQVRTKSWSSMRLSGVLAGDDPMKAIGNLVADWWIREHNRILVASLHGVYLDNVANDDGDMVNNIAATTGTPTDVNLISAEAILDTKQTMGDAAEDLSTLIMHSAVYTRLQKQNLIDFIPDARGEIRFPSYLGYRVVVSDTVHIIDNGTDNPSSYVTYLIGRDAIAYNEQPMRTSPNVETERKPDQGNGVGGDILYTRRQFVMHPYGIAWQDASVAGEFPTNAELATAANWNRVYPERKQVALAYLVTNG